MQEFDFDKFVDRRDTAALKWSELPDGGKDVIPLWVADMDFEVAPCIKAALRSRVEHGVFGYVAVPDAYYEAVIGWYRRRHGVELRREWIKYTTGVVPAISAIIKALTSAGDRVAVLTPVYNCFFSSIRNNGCEALEIPLALDGDNYYTIDFERLDASLADARVKVLQFCNPHNPAERVWTKVELLRVAQIALKHGVIVISDEIHCELIMPGHRFTCMATLGEPYLNNTIICSSPSKNFNTAGLQVANIITERVDWRERIDRAININETCDVNPFGVEALIAAYNEGEQWLEALCRYIEGNFELLRDVFTRELPALRVTPLEGTYLAWVDIRPLGRTSQEMTDYLLEHAKVLVNSGDIYGAAGEGFIRINIALPRERLRIALTRIVAALTQRQ